MRNPFRRRKPTNCAGDSKPPELLLRHIDRPENQPERRGGEKRHEDVGHRKMRIPDVQDGHRQERCGDQTGCLTTDPLPDPVQHEHRHRARAGNAGAGNEQLLSAGQVRSEPGHPAQRASNHEQSSKQVKRQRRPVKESRVEIATQNNPDGFTDRYFFVRPGMEMR